jgi:hypothetical protein
MTAGPKVCAGVAIGRGIATPRAAARLAGAEVHPARPNLDTVLTLVRPGGLDVGDAAQVRARSVVDHER